MQNANRENALLEGKKLYESLKKDFEGKSPNLKNCEELLRKLKVLLSQHSFFSSLDPNGKKRNQEEVIFTSI
jgi:hypothetical protein